MAEGSQTVTEADALPGRGRNGQGHFRDHRPALRLLDDDDQDCPAIPRPRHQSPGSSGIGTSRGAQHDELSAIEQIRCRLCPPRTRPRDEDRSAQVEAELSHGGHARVSEPDRGAPVASLRRTGEETDRQRRGAGSSVASHHDGAASSKVS